MNNSLTMALTLMAASSAMTLQTDNYASACTEIENLVLGPNSEQINDQEDGCCTFFRGRDYFDRALQCCHIGISTEIALKGTNWDNQITSFKCGAGVKYELWRGNIDNEDSKITQITGAGEINNPVLSRYNDLISNIVLEPYDVKVNPAVTIFNRPGC